MATENESTVGLIDPSTKDGVVATDRLASWARSQPDKPALIEDPPEGPVRTLTYHELDREANRFANALIRAGVEPGERTAWMGRNSIEAVEFIRGAMRVGTPAVPLNHRMQREDAARVLRFAKARLVWVHAELAGMLVGIEEDTHVERVVVFGGSPGAGQMSAEAFLDGVSTDPPPPPPASALATGFGSFTSGTTGAPKRIMRTFARGSSEVNHQARVWGPDPHVFITSGSIASGASGGFYVTALERGDTVVLQERFEAEDYLRLVDRYGVSFAYLSPTVARQLGALPPEVRARYDTSRWRTVFGGASKWSHGVKTAFHSAFPETELWEIYGSSELGSNTVMPPDEHWDRPESCGKPVPGVELQLRGPEGEVITEPRVQGLLWIKSDHASGFVGYEGDEVATAAAVDGDWRTTSDIAYFDEDGYYYICDRAKDMVVSGGINVYPAEVEAVIDRCEGVLECCVIGIPDDTWGERVHAVAVALPGSSVDAETVIAFCRERLASHKVPRSVDFVDELPHTVSGKILKRQVREMYWETAGRKI